MSGLFWWSAVTTSMVLATALSPYFFCVVLDGHLDRDLAVRAGEVLVDAGLVVEHPEDDLVVGERSAAGGGATAAAGGEEESGADGSGGQGEGRAAGHAVSQGAVVRWTDGVEVVVGHGPRSHAEVVEQLLAAGPELVVVERLDDPSLREEVVAVGHGGREGDVLLDEEHRGALRLDRRG